MTQSTQGIKDSVQRQFGQVAENYRTSAVHMAGADMDAMIEAAALQGHERILDAGTGTGHTALAFAPRVTHVTAFDLTEPMLEQGRKLAAERGLTNLDFRQGDVEEMPFEDAAFDLVVSRYSAHHWPRPARALQEIARVLKPGGMFLLGDIVAPADPTRDTFLQTLELLRDPSHVRDHSIAQWSQMFEAAGFSVDVAFEWRLPLNFDSWVTRMATPPDVVNILKWLYNGAPEEVRRAMDIDTANGSYDFTIEGALFRGRK